MQRNGGYQGPCGSTENLLWRKKVEGGQLRDDGEVINIIDETRRLYTTYPCVSGGSVTRSIRPRPSGDGVT